MVTKIYDCSNSNERPEHRGKGCPIENDIVRYLKENSSHYNCSFVENIEFADVLFTNDVFPEKYYNLNIPKIKRMDGVFWERSLLTRNEKLNKSAEIANTVIFISDYSKKSYLKLYGNKLNKYTVTINQADPSIFYKTNYSEELIFITTASSWEREEKRLNDLLKFADNVKEVIYVIGNIPTNIKVPSNLIPLGYVNNPKDIAKNLNKATAFLNLSYKDACPKTVVQALCCGLPVLFANSGGVGEMVEEFGVKIKDTDILQFETGTRELDVNNMIDSYSLFKLDFLKLRLEVSQRDNIYKFDNMLNGYFEEIHKLNDKNR